MDDETIDLPLAPKKPYVRPQLHELTGSSADGKEGVTPIEVSALTGPS
jgi:hypothetical protein